MEQQLDVTYLRPSFVSKAFAISVAAMSIGTSILLIAYGISLIWRPMPASNVPFEFRIANPDLTVRQEKPFVMAPPETPHIDAQAFITRPAQTPNSERPTAAGDPQAPREDVIQREVIVFSSIRHAVGSVITGWKYPNGSGRTPSEQFCYYISPNADKSSTKVNIALNGTPLSETATALVPESEQAIKKCQWWHA
jgi:hypothetical protein